MKFVSELASMNNKLKYCKKNKPSRHFEQIQNVQFDSEMLIMFVGLPEAFLEIGVTNPAAPAWASSMQEFVTQFLTDKKKREIFSCKPIDPMKNQMFF